MKAILLRSASVVLCLLSGLTGCQRPTADGDRSTVSLALPAQMKKVSSLAAEDSALAHVTVNITGSGISAPALLNWDSCNDCQTSSAVPSNFSLTVPSGSARLIQVLAVYRTSVSGQMIFYYGDQTADLNANEVAISVPMDRLGSGTVVDGSASGRYFTSAAGGPTDLVDIKYAPSGKPAMLIQTKSIVNGWFDLLMMSGVSFMYQLRSTGEILWGKPMSLDEPEMDPATNSGANFAQRAKLYVPMHQRANQNNGVTTWTASNAREHAWGYWGPGADGKVICRSGLESVPSLQQLRLYGAAAQATGGLTVQTLKSPTEAPPTVAMLTNSSEPLGSVFLQGGVAMTAAGTCGTFSENETNRFLNYQLVSLSMIDGGGNDSLPGFRGVVQSLSNQVFSLAGDPLALSGRVLPGVESVFTGLRLFKKSSTSDSQSDVFDCANPDGYVGGSSADAAIASDRSFSIASNISLREAGIGVATGLCGVTRSGLFALGSGFSYWQLKSGSSGGSNAVSLAIITPQGTADATVGNNVCTPIWVEGRDASGNPTSITGPINLRWENATVNFYDPQYTQCYNAGTSVNTGGSLRSLLYIRRTASGSMDGRIYASTSSLPEVGATVHYVDPPSSPVVVRVRMPSSINAYDCIPLSLETWVDTGTPSTSMIIDAGTTTVTMPTINGLTYYSDRVCSYSSTGSLLSIYGGSLAGSIRYTGTAASLALNPTGSDPVVSGLQGATVAVVLPGPLANLNVGIASTLAEGSIQPVQITLADSQYRTTTSATSVVVNLPATGFYQDSYASTGITSVTIPAGSFSTTVYYRPAAPGTATLNFSSASPFLSTSRMVNVNPALYSKAVAAFAGQTFVSGNATPVQGQPEIAYEGAPILLKIYLLKYDNTVDTTQNGAFVSSIYGSGATFPSTSAIQFINGVATIPVIPDGSTNYIYLSTINLTSGIYGYGSGTVTVKRAADTLKVYMAHSSSLAPGACQIFMIVPEKNGSGAAAVVMPQTVQVTASSGARVYSNSTCSTDVTGQALPLSLTTTAIVLFMQQSTASATTTLTVTPSIAGGQFAQNVFSATTASSGSPGTMYQYLLTGAGSGDSLRTMTCQPYVVSMADSVGNSVDLASALNFTVSTTYGSWVDATCTQVLGTTQTIPANGYSVIYLSTSSGGSYGLTIGGSYSAASGSVTVSY